MTFMFHYVVGPLMADPIGEMGVVVNKLHLKYKTYIVEYDVEDVGGCSVSIQFTCV